MKETGLTGKRRSTTIAATPDDGKSQRKRRSLPIRFSVFTQTLSDLTLDWSKVRSDKLLCVNTALDCGITVRTRLDEGKTVASTLYLVLRKLTSKI